MLERISTRAGKRGVALAELLVAMALLAIVSTMIVSFSAVVDDFVDSQQGQYAFIEETAQVNEAISAWLSQMDEDGVVYAVTEDAISVDALGASVIFDEWTQCLILTAPNGAVDRVEAKSVESVQFTVKQLSAENTIVKCTVIGAEFMKEQSSQSFLLSLRCGSFAG